MSDGKKAWAEDLEREAEELAAKAACKCGSNKARGRDCICGNKPPSVTQVTHIVPPVEKHTPVGYGGLTTQAPNQVRKFETGATRSADTGRYDPEGFMHPVVIERFCEYMHRNRIQPDGSVRDSDNWQKGIPFATYVKGLWRHFLHLWTRHRGSEPYDDKASDSAVDDCCAILFNAHGYIFEVLKATGRIK